jgi:hypothetical protein
MIDPDHAKRVMNHIRETPVMVLAKYYSMTKNPSPVQIMRAKGAIAALVVAGYAIEPIEGEDED